MINQNGYVKWSVLVTFLGIISSILGLIYNELKNTKEELIQIKVDSAVTRERVDNLTREFGLLKSILIKNGRIQ